MKAIIFAVAVMFAVATEAQNQKQFYLSDTIFKVSIDYGQKLKSLLAYSDHYDKDIMKEKFFLFSQEKYFCKCKKEVLFALLSFNAPGNDHDFAVRGDSIIESTLKQLSVQGYRPATLFEMLVFEKSCENYLLRIIGNKRPGLPSELSITALGSKFSMREIWGAEYCNNSKVSLEITTRAPFLVLSSQGDKKMRLQIISDGLIDNLAWSSNYFLLVKD